LSWWSIALQFSECCTSPPPLPTVIQPVVFGRRPHASPRRLPLISRSHTPRLYRLFPYPPPPSLPVKK
jgi:hypothetical protein